MKTEVIVYVNDESNGKKHNSLNKICFKPMIEYTLKAASIFSDNKPYIYTNNTRIIENYKEKFDIIDDFEIFKNKNEVDYIVIINAETPLITADAIENSIAYMQQFELCTLFVGEGVIIVNKAMFNQIELLFSDTEALNCEKTGYYDSFASETMVCSHRIDIAYADRIMRLNINFDLMEKGVEIIDPESTYIEDGVKIGSGTVIYPGTFIEGDTVIGENCQIFSGTNIKNAKIGDEVVINHSVINDSSIGNNTNVGPFAYVRPNSVVGNNVKVGDFVELKKANIGDGTKISHLTYVGDSNVGKNVNFGCGTVTVNYDGKNKFLTEIGDNVFIGCNTNLVAPVKVGNNSFIAAGSTITDEVPDNAFSIARQRQVNKENWVKPKDRNK